MFSRMRERITYANVAMTLALVFAMGGGAYAAKKSNWIITSKKQIKPTVLKALEGKQGKQGKQGATGPTGPTGQQGPAGANGKDGTPGSPGQNGVSVTLKQLGSGDTACNKEGGAEFTAAESKKATVCNGKTGFTEMLPSGKSEKGDWAVSGIGVEDSALSGATAVEGSISFNIPLAAAPKAHVIAPGETPSPGSGCTGTVSSPEAEPGNLCIFTFARQNALIVDTAASGTGEFFEADPTGCLLFLFVKTKTEAAMARGTWAVTAE